MQNVAFPYEKLLAFVVIASLFIYIALIKKEFEVYRLDVGFFAMIVVTFVSILGAADMQAGWEDWQKFWRMFLVYLIMVRIIKTEGQLKAVIMLFIISVGFLAVSSTIQYYRGEFEVRQGIQRLHSFGGGLIDPNTMATSLILGLPFMYYMARAHRNLLLKGFMLGLMGACMWAIMLTGSRGGMVGAIVVLMVLTYQSKHKVAGFVVAAMVFAVVAVVAPDQYRDRFMSIFNIGASAEEDEFGAAESARGRINGFKLGFKFLLKNPISGVGIGNFGWHHHAEPGGDWTDAHNLIGKLVGELGFLGIFAFSFFITRFVQSIKYVKRTFFERGWQSDFLFYMAQAVLVGLIMLFVQGLFGHNLYRDNWYVYAAFIAIISKLVEQRKLAEIGAEGHDRPLVPAEAHRGKP
jgi:probable O-glycosylation ligase (exosortase A-associated)